MDKINWRIIIWLGKNIYLAVTIIIIELNIFVSFRVIKRERERKKYCTTKMKLILKTGI